jgi:Xaa-Pro dipeptidase
MLDALGDRYVPRTRGEGPVHAGFISGPQTRLPHGHTANRRLERTMFVGEASDEDQHYFELMCEAQRIAVEAMGPGVEIAAVDRAVQEYFAEQNVTDLARHHVGHNIGLGGHEPPYIDRGWTRHCEEREERVEADAAMEPGHVYTIEPGIYTDDAGYRHSDTVAVREDGTERLTYFPRELAANVIR